MSKPYKNQPSISSKRLKEILLELAETNLKCEQNKANQCENLHR